MFLHVSYKMSREKYLDHNFFGTWVSLTKDVSDVWKPMDDPRKFSFVLVLIVVVQQPEKIHGS